MGLIILFHRVFCSFPNKASLKLFHQFYKAGKRNPKGSQNVVSDKTVVHTRMHHELQFGRFRLDKKTISHLKTPQRDYVISILEVLKKIAPDKTKKDKLQCK